MTKKPKFNQPRILISRVYTKTGDQGETSLVGGHRVPKDASRIQAYGTVDELNSLVGLACQTAQGLESSFPRFGQLSRALVRIQQELFNLGAALATRIQDLRSRQPRIREEDILRLEEEVDRLNQELPVLHSFVIPGGNRISAELHVCRAVCRRAERLCVSLAHEEELLPETLPYLNRLGDAFFVWSRWASLVLGQVETLWDPNISDEQE
ncbi:MAG TPA: cob(I)yrinic acid a,c-diamide adenosyltransferase [Terriglobia bacterium]|nr:cob(I)yrinic acid a,c-diamide adenosyltransferase [Terriglobia bacterium]